MKYKDNKLYIFLKGFDDNQLGIICDELGVISCWKTPRSRRYALLKYFAEIEYQIACQTCWRILLNPKNFNDLCNKRWD